MDKVFYFIRVTLARSYVRIIGAQRELSWVLGDTLLPLLAVSAYVMIYKAMGAPPEYTGFVILGGMIVTFWMHMIWSMGMQFFWEKEMGNLERYLMSPLPRSALLLGMAFGGMIMTSTRALMIYLVAKFMFNLEFNVSDPILAIGVFLATMVALYGMGMMMSSLFFIAGRGIYYSLQLMAEPIFFLGGFYFPVKQLGVVTAFTAAAFIPTTLGLDALRQLMFSAPEIGLISPFTEMMILSVMGVVFVTASIYILERMEQVGRAEGKLILKNQ